MKWFGADGGEPEEYQGGREVLDLAKLCVKRFVVFVECG